MASIAAEIPIVPGDIWNFDRTYSVITKLDRQTVQITWLKQPLAELKGSPTVTIPISQLRRDWTSTL